jgi:hypothetical protein
MNVASMGAMHAAIAPNNVTPQKAPAAAEGPGPDHDGDSDDAGGAVKSATTQAVGGLLDSSA